MPRLTAVVLGTTTAAQHADACMAEAPGTAAAPVPKHPLPDEPRLYRHADGRLSPTRPPPEPYTVAARRDWSDLVSYTRMHGGCAECTQEGTCLCHGTGVSFEEMCEYLGKLGVPLENDTFGWFGHDKSKPLNPLDDPEHPLYVM